MTKKTAINKPPNHSVISWSFKPAIQKSNTAHQVKPISSYLGFFTINKPKPVTIANTELIASKGTPKKVEIEDIKSNEMVDRPKNDLNNAEKSSITTQPYEQNIAINHENINQSTDNTSELSFFATCDLNFDDWLYDAKDQKSNNLI